MLALPRAFNSGELPMPRTKLHLTWGAFLLAAAVLSAQAQPPDGEPPAGDTETAKKERLAFLHETFATYSLAAPGEGAPPFAQSDGPLVRYSNPVRNAFSDAAVFLWLDDTRPRAAASISIRGNRSVGREFSSLSSEPLECRGEAGERWSPKSAGLAEQDLPNAPTPDATDKLRLVQMRRLARRFRFVMKETATTDQTELRLMSQPIYRFAADKAGIIDGALFAFAEGTDPEALLLLEAVRGAGESLAWRYTLARMTSRPIEAEVDDRPIWSAEGYWANPRSPSDPYVEIIRGSYPAAP
jgi:hypothetical protein